MGFDGPKEDIGERWTETLAEGPSYPGACPVSLDWVRGDLTCASLYVLDSQGRATGNSSSDGLLPTRSHKEHGDFDDGANALWSLYGKAAKTHDEARFQRVAEDMNGVLTFAGLFSAVLTSFLVQSIQNLQVNPAQQSSAAVLAQISQQIASIALQSLVPSAAQQVSIPSTSPLPYPAFQPLFSDIRVNMYWVVGLVCSLSAALLAILIQQWVRSYMRVFQQYDRPLRRARFRQFFFEGANGMRNLAEAVPRLIHVSLFLFFLGLGDAMLKTNTTVGVTTIVLICICGSFYLYSVSEHAWDLQSPYKT
ncbi:hypothetical protein H4582DRAFT_1814206, partial [Lactarius indigo]